MTIDAFTQAAEYLIQGIGPYQIPHPYIEDAITASVVIDAAPVALSAGDDYSVDPISSTEQGNLYLSAAAATAHAGRALWIDRQTDPVQNWEARLGDREVGMEAQLDRDAMALQEVRLGMQASLRGRRPALPYDPQPGHVPVARADGLGFENGPTLTEIAGAKIFSELAQQAAADTEQYRHDMLSMAWHVRSYQFVATAGQTVFSGADQNGAVLEISARPMVVHEGSIVPPSDFTVAPDGSAVTLGYAAVAGDVIVIHASVAAPLADYGAVRNVGARTVLVALTAAGAFDGYADGAEVAAGGLRYRRASGAVVIPDLPGWMPAGAANVGHWGVTTVISPNSAAIDDTARVNAAFAATTGEIEIDGWVKVTGMITIPPMCRPVVRRGSRFGGFAVFPDFNLAAGAVVRLTGEVAGIPSLGFWAEQAAAEASGLRSDLVAYPPFLDISTATRGQYGALYFSGGIDAIRGAGNCGGSRFAIIESGCFGDDLFIDGALDFVHIESFESWPYGFAGNANLSAIFYDRVGHAVRLVRCDGFAADKIATFRKKVVLDQVPSSNIPYMITTLQLDGDGAVFNAPRGRAIVGALYSTSSFINETRISVSGGKITVNMLAMIGAPDVGIDVSAGMLNVLGGEIRVNSLSKIAARVSGGLLALKGVGLAWPAGVLTTPFIQQSGAGVLHITDCLPLEIGPPSAVARVATDARHYVDMASLAPHSVELPSSGSLGQYRSSPLAWVPALTFQNPAGFSASYSLRTGHIVFDGSRVHVTCRLTATLSLGGATGGLRITGLPTIPTLADTEINAALVTVVNDPTREDTVIRFVGAAQQLQVLRSGGNATASQLTADMLTDGSTIQIMFEGSIWR